MKAVKQKSVPLSPATLHILLALADEDLHGYGIIQKVFRQSQQHYKLGPGTLYDNLKKLIDKHHVVDAPKSSLQAGEKRRLYRLTQSGRSALSIELNRLASVLREAKPLVADGKLGSI